MIYSELRHIKCCYHTLLSCLQSPYLIFKYLTLCDVTDDVIWQGSFGVISVFANNFRSNCARVEKGTICAGTYLPNRLTCSSTSKLNPWPGGVTWLWPRGQSWIWSLPNKKHINRRGLMWEFIRGAVFLAHSHFRWRYEPKTKPRPISHWPGLWGHQLTWDLIFGYQSLQRWTHLFFHVALAQ